MSRALNLEPLMESLLTKSCLVFDSPPPPHPPSTMTDMQALLSAIDVFGRAPDKLSLDTASTWLQDFQHSVNPLSGEISVSTL